MQKAFTSLWHILAHRNRQDSSEQHQLIPDTALRYLNVTLTTNTDRGQCLNARLKDLAAGRPLVAELGHTNSNGQRRVDARVGRKLGRKAATQGCVMLGPAAGKITGEVASLKLSPAAGGAGLFALCNPLVEAAKTEIVLAGRLRRARSVSKGTRINTEQMFKKTMP